MRELATALAQRPSRALRVLNLCFADARADLLRAVVTERRRASGAAIASLEELALAGNLIGAEGAPWVAAWVAAETRLALLDVTSAMFDGNAARFLAPAVARHAALTTLLLPHNHLGVLGGEAVGAMLRDNTSLVELNLNHNGLGDPGVRFIGEALEVNTTLRVLRLEGNALGENGVRWLAGGLDANCTLWQLSLNNNPGIGPRGLRPLLSVLPTNFGLRTLELGGCMLSSPGAACLAAALRGNRTLQELDLAGNFLMPAGLLALAPALAAHPALVRVNLGNNGLEIDQDVPNRPGEADEADGDLAAAVAALLHYQPGTQGLRDVVLDGNSLGDAAAEAMAERLAGHPSLQSLLLSHNRLGPQGVLALAGRLPATLTTLHMNRNARLGDAGAAALAVLALAAHGGVLAELHVAACGFTPAAAPALGDILRSGLVRIHLGFNVLGDSGVVALAPALARTTVLEELNLVRVDVEDVGARALTLAAAHAPRLFSVKIGQALVNTEPALALEAVLARNATVAGLVERVLALAIANARHAGGLPAAVWAPLLLPPLRAAALVRARLSVAEAARR